jgi:DNA-directed RNA polymerase alpha subunit
MTPLPKIGKPATNALAAAGITTLEAVATLSHKELLALHGFGPKAITILEPELARLGLALQPEAKRP